MMTGAKIATGWKEADIEQLRRFGVKGYMEHFIGGDTPREKEITLRELCGEDKDYNGSIAGYMKEEGNLPPFSWLSEKEEVAPGIAHCGWHPVCSVIAGIAPPTEAQFEYFYETFEQMKNSRAALAKKLDGANNEQREFLERCSSLDELAEALLNFRLSQLSRNSKELEQASDVVREVWLDMQFNCPPKLEKSITRLLDAGFFAARATSTDVYYKEISFIERLKRNNGMSKELRIGYREEAGKYKDNVILRTLLFAFGAMRFNGKKWAIKRPRWPMRVGRAVILLEIVFFMLCFISLDFKLAEGAIGLLTQAGGWCGVGASVLFIYLWLMWPMEKVNEILSEKQRAS